MFKEDHADRCPYCRIPLEIVVIKFRLRGGSEFVISCPNCANASTQGNDTGKPNGLGRFALVAKGSEPVVASVDQLTLRAWHFVGFVFAALFTAALLRHGLHMYGGLPREEIRWYTIALLVIALPAILLLRKRWRNGH